ncbi:MAG: ABC transporter permease, partial [Alphaproteobacteria bacterium]|nr:ABC transporter permease [Alphaproteobacteria bacterium]
MASTGTNVTVVARTAALRRIDTATHWQLMWWKFRRHKMALLGGGVLAFMVFFSLFAEFFAPYTPQERTAKYAQGQPMGFH